MRNSENKEKIRIRRIQAIHGERTMVLCIPRDFISDLQIAKGDYVKCIVNDKEQLVVEKAFPDSQIKNVRNNENSAVMEAQI